MKPASRVAMCSLSSALSVLILFLGGVITIFAYISPMITGVIMIMLVKTFGYSSAWITYVVTSALSFLLVPDKECMLMYVVFFGYYTIIKISLDKISIKPLRIFVKFIIFNVAMIAENLLMLYVFGVPLFESETGKWVFVACLVGLNLIFILFDKLLSISFILYEKKIVKRIKHIMH